MLPLPAAKNAEVTSLHVRFAIRQADRSRGREIAPRCERNRESLGDACEKAARGVALGVMPPRLYRERYATSSEESITLIR